MKRNLPGCFSLVFLVLFTCTFSFRQVAAATGNLSRCPLDIFKSFEKRAQDCIPEDSALFENESKDETEDEAAASFAVVSCQTSGTFLFDPITAPGNTFSFSALSFNSAIKNPFYLVMRSLRV